jgi:hypothetical protein
MGSGASLTDRTRGGVASGLLPIVLGITALAIGSAAGLQPALLDAIVNGPPLLRAALAGASVVVGVALLRGALMRLEASRGDVAGMARGIRLVFLAVAAVAAATGWVVGHPLPIIVALLIAGVDVVETSFLLVVAGRGR